jgi:anthranilate synthase/aminodeoxychorismate synthase-like glutamine amidotransferase
MLLIVDNFDSFTYNLVQAFKVLGVETHVIRNNALESEALKLDPAFLVISPGPGHPSQAGLSNSLIRTLAGRIPILGVCLGHQCIGEMFGGKVMRARQPMHGKLSAITHNGKGVFRHLPQSFLATRYHSLILERDSLPNCLEISAETAEGEIMGISHREWAIEGIQFHPESIMTQEGMALLTNFITQPRNQS